MAAREAFLVAARATCSVAATEDFCMAAVRPALFKAGTFIRQGMKTLVRAIACNGFLLLRSR